MANTSIPGRPFPGAGEYPLEAGHFDEAFAPTGVPRHPYAELLGALARHVLVVLRERVRSNVEPRRSAAGAHPFGRRIRPHQL